MGICIHWSHRYYTHTLRALTCLISTESYLYSLLSRLVRPSKRVSDGIFTQLHKAKGGRYYTEQRNWAQTVPNTQHFTYLRGLFFILNLTPEHVILSRADWYCYHIWQRAAVVCIFTCPEIVTLETNEIQTELYFSASTRCPSANRYQQFSLRDQIFIKCVTSIVFQHRLTLFTVKLLISSILSTNISGWRPQYK